MLHIQIRFLTPVRLFNVPQPSTNEHQCGLPIRESTDCPGSAPEFPVQAFHRIIRADPSPVLPGEVHISQGFPSACFHLFRSFDELHLFKFLDNVLNLQAGYDFVLLSMDCFEHGCHQFYLSPGYRRENVPVKVHHTALVPCPGINLMQGLHQP